MTENARDQVIAADAAFRAAVVAGDVAGLSAVLAPGFVYIHSSGLEDSRDAFLARAGGAGPVVYVQRDVQNLATNLHGESATLTGHTCIGFRRGDEAVERRWSNFLAAWVREGGAWRMAAYAGAPLPDSA
jgi:ketosteroid isomerase-like protein